MNANLDPLRLYVEENGDLFGTDGYPNAWHSEVKGLVREQAGNRCARCKHPFTTKSTAKQLGIEATPGRWSPCDELCSHGMPARCLAHPFESLGAGTTTGALIREAREQGVEREIEAEWRVLTVHHLDGQKANCRWWNLAALCQRCHLEIQGKVVLDRPWPWPHSEWMRPYVAGFYALKYLGEDLPSRPSDERIAELLESGQREEAAERMPV